MPPESWCGYSSKRFSGSGMCTERSSSMPLSLAVALSMPRFLRSGSVICLPIFITGFSDVIGSWKTIAMSLPQKRRILLSGRFKISWPAYFTLPLRITLRLGSRLMIERLSTVLPEPDSPTMPSVLPRRG